MHVRKWFNEENKRFCGESQIIYKVGSRIEDNGIHWLAFSPASIFPTFCTSVSHPFLLHGTILSITLVWQLFEVTIRDLKFSFWWLQVLEGFCLWQCCKQSLYNFWPLRIMWGILWLKVWTHSLDLFVCMLYSAHERSCVLKCTGV